MSVAWPDESGQVGLYPSGRTTVAAGGLLQLLCVSTFRTRRNARRSTRLFGLFRCAFQRFIRSRRQADARQANREHCG